MPEPRPNHRSGPSKQSPSLSSDLHEEVGPVDTNLVGTAVKYRAE
jgi:hypothetical protein